MPNNSLTPAEKSRFEELFDMGRGYVLGYSDASFGALFGEVVNIGIHDSKYCARGTSKANKLRTFWSIEPDITVGKLLSAMLDEIRIEHLSEAEKVVFQECKTQCSGCWGIRPFSR